MSVPLTVPGDEVRDAEKARDERGGRRFVELGGCAELLDPAVVHDRDLVGHRHRLFLVVRDVDERDADVVLNALELELHLLAELQVEGAERLVQQEHRRLVDEGAGERDALLLASGKLARLPLLHPLQPDEPQDLVDLAGQRLSSDPAATQAEGDVLEDREMRKERVGLEDGVDVSLVGGEAR